MIGKVGITNRIGGYCIASYQDGGKMQLRLPKGAVILCTNCEIENEASLITNGDISKFDKGYNVLNTLNIFILSYDSLTVLHGRELLFASYKDNGDETITFNLPKGARINRVLVENTGEITIPVSTNYLIEY